MYTDAKINEHAIKLIFDNGARIITANGVTKISIGEIDNFLFKVNSIITPIKVLVMKATQYQALVDNNWLVLAMCRYFKPITMPSVPLIKFKKEKEKPT
ncbi:hypothetical protein G9A89_016430 [Geosiphon pyriformis]|nr:hypothetical protein G9A89_016430 [Geosiphon pyriformis]